MEETAKKKKDKVDKKQITKNNKQPRRINTHEFAGTVKSFKNFDALAYQRSIRGE